ncbi:MAG: hypothetical protein ABI147_11555 [Acidobacteriaceae bacterium]
MKIAAVTFALLLLQGDFDRGAQVEAVPKHFQFQRVLNAPAGANGQACAVLDAAVYGHSDGRLDQLRIYSDGHEVPYARTESGEVGQQEEPARVMNLGRKGAAIVFDLAMPQRAYTEVVLDLAGKDFYAIAKVSGADWIGARRTDLGQFVLFDLRSRRLSRSTTLALQESSFAVLHVEMTVMRAPGGDAKTLGPGMVRGAVVPPSREAQRLYTTVAETGTIIVKGRESLARIDVAAHVPVERVSFVLQPDFAKNFSREVRAAARSSLTQDSSDADIVSGEIRRVRLPVNATGEEIRSEQFSVEALLAANLRSDAVVDVAVENGDDAPLPLRAVQLQMRQRKICFDAQRGAQYVLRYGDVEPVRSPVYNYARLFRASATAAAATLGPETPNPQFRRETRRRSYKERHPEVLWVALLIAIGVLGTVALHNARRVGRGK